MSPCGDVVEGSESLDHLLDGLVKGPGGVRGNDGRDLYRDILRLRAGENLSNVAQSLVCLRVTQDSLAKQVHVQSGIETKFLGRPAESVLRSVNDKVRNKGAQHCASNWDNRPWHKGCEVRPQTKQCSQRPWQETWRKCSELVEVCCSDTDVFRADYAIDEANSKVKPIWVL